MAVNCSSGMLFLNQTGCVGGKSRSNRSVRRPGETWEHHWRGSESSANLFAQRFWYSRHRCRETYCSWAQEGEVLPQYYVGIAVHYWLSVVNTWYNGLGNVLDVTTLVKWFGRIKLNAQQMFHKKIVLLQLYCTGSDFNLNFQFVNKDWFLASAAEYKRCTAGACSGAASDRRHPFIFLRVHLG